MLRFSRRSIRERECVILIVISRAALNLMQHSASFDSELLEIVCFRKTFAHFTFGTALASLN